MKRKLLITVVLALVFAFSFGTTAFASDRIQDSTFKIVSKTEYDNMNEKEQEEYLEIYCTVIEKSINAQIKEIHDSFIKELKNQEEFGKASELEKFSKESKVELDINNEAIKEKLERSLTEPVVFNETNLIPNFSEGSYVSRTTDGYMAYGGRTVTHSLYASAYSTSGTWNGDDYKTYDISQYYYSWVGSSASQDRMDYVNSGVVQYDARTAYVGNYTFNTGWPDHYYTGSFSKYAATINLNPGCVLARVGGASAGVHAKAVFSNGSVVKYDDLSADFGGTVWVY